VFNCDVLTFREFAMREALPLSSIHNAVLEFVRGRDDLSGRNVVSLARILPTVRT
jgi:hypothetical protein